MKEFYETFSIKDWSDKDGESRKKVVNAIGIG